MDLIDEHELLDLLKKAREYEDHLGIDSRELRPVIINIRNDEIIDGKHRLEADPEWPVRYIDVDPTSIRLDIFRLVLNYGRRQISKDEKREIILKIATETGWNALKISEETGIPIATVYRYLPAEHKRSYIFKKENKVVSQEPINLSRDRLVNNNPKAVLNDKRKIPSTLEPIFIPKEVLIRSTLNEISKKFPEASPRFLANAVSREHGLSFDDALQLANEYCSVQQEYYKSRRDRNLSMFSCPICGIYRHEQMHRKSMKSLENQDPQLYKIAFDRLKKKGWNE